MADTKDTVPFDILEHFVTFGERKDNRWTKEANIVSWNGEVPKVDIREWAPGHERMFRGVELLLRFESVEMNGGQHAIFFIQQQKPLVTPINLPL